MRRLRTLQCMAAILALSPAMPVLAVDFVNGAFESPLATGWTVTGSQAELITNADADADNEARLYWNYQTAVFPYGGNPVNTSMSQTVTLDSTDYTLAFNATCVYYDPDFMAGHGDAYAVISAELLDSGDAVLAGKSWTNITGWQQVNLHIHTFALSRSVNPANVAKVRLSAVVNGTPPVNPGWSVSASIKMDDVALQPTPAAVEDWFIFE